LIPTKRKVSLSTFVTPIFIVVSLIVIVVLLEDRRSIAGYFQGLKGGSQFGLALAYAGSLLLLSAQFYTIVKRSAWIGFIKSMGGVRPWLSIHITLSFIGLIAVLIHAGFPYRFTSDNLVDHGLAGLTTWLLIASAASGVFGRYIYKRLPAMKRVFGYWKPSHLFITGLLFFAAIIHMLTAFGN
jgi:hypothetical protein